MLMSELSPQAVSRTLAYARDNELNGLRSGFLRDENILGKGAAARNRGLILLEIRSPKSMMLSKKRPILPMVNYIDFEKCLQSDWETRISQDKYS